MTRAEYLRSAAKAERLADWVRVSHASHVYLRRDDRGLQPYLFTVRDSSAEISPRRSWEAVCACTILVKGHHARKTAIRAGLIALAERLERQENGIDPRDGEQLALDLDAIETRMNEATPGPWVAWENDWRDDDEIDPEVRVLSGTAIPDQHGSLPVLSTSTDTIMECDFLTEDEAGQKFENACFIAHARTDLPLLVAEVRRQRLEIEHLRKLLGGEPERYVQDDGSIVLMTHYVSATVRRTREGDAASPDGYAVEFGGDKCGVYPELAEQYGQLYLWAFQEARAWEGEDVCDACGDTLQPFPCRCDREYQSLPPIGSGFESTS